MLPEIASNAEFRSMFLDEGQIVGAITHPNVVRVHEVAEQQASCTWPWNGSRATRSTR